MYEVSPSSVLSICNKTHNHPEMETIEVWMVRLWIFKVKTTIKLTSEDWCVTCIRILCEILYFFKTLLDCENL